MTSIDSQATNPMDAITKPADDAKPFSFKEFGDTLGEFFSSLKLAIFLMITLAILSTVGTVIQQGERPEVYIKEYGENAYWWFVKLGFVDIYHTWYFSTVLVLLCINSLTCFHQRFPAIWRSIRQDKVNVTASFIQNLKRSAMVALPAERSKVTEQLGLAFAERGYRVLINKGDTDTLVYKGIWFYQSSYGDSWDRVEKARIVVREKASDKVVGEAILDWRKEAELKNLGLKLQVTDFVADFGFDAKARRVYSKTVEHENPAVRLAITEHDRQLATPWIFYHYPDLFEIQGSQYKFELTGYLTKKFTGLQIAKDPGVIIVWIGSTLLVVGVMLSALIFHRRVWAKVVSEPHGVTVYLGGTAYKGQIDFDREFHRLSERLKAMRCPTSPSRSSRATCSWSSNTGSRPSGRSSCRSGLSRWARRRSCRTATRWRSRWCRR